MPSIYPLIPSFSKEGWHSYDGVVNKKTILRRDALDGFFIGVILRYSPEIILGGCSQMDNQGCHRYKTPLKII